MTNRKSHPTNHLYSRLAARTHRKGQAEERVEVQCPECRYELETGEASPHEHDCDPLVQQALRDHSEDEE